MIEQERRLGRLLPAAEIRLSGSASLPGLDANDLDFVALVEDVAGAVEILRGEYPVLYPEEWSDDWAAFRDPGPPQVDVVVTRGGTLGEKHHVLAWQFLATRPDLLEEYRRLKSTGGDYERRKREFFERVVSLL